MQDSERSRRLEALRAQYVERLHDDVQAVMAQVEEMSTRENAAAAVELETVCEALQRIADSAGSFGYDALSDTCAEVACQVRQWLDGEVLPAPYTLAALQSRLQHGAQQLPNLEELLPAHAAPGQRGAAAVRVALLGDEPQRRSELGEALSALGYECHGYAMCDVEALMAWCPEAVLIDERSVPRSRWSVWWVEWPSSPHLLVFGDEDDFTARLSAIRHGAVGYFVPPLDASSIGKCLDRLVSSPTPEPLRVLIVDDDIELAEHYHLVLDGAGIDSWMVNVPAETLVALRDYRPDLALVDTRLPTCTGREMARVMRLDDAWRDLPVVYLAAGDDVREQALTRSGDVFLGKPVDDDALVATVLSHAHRARDSRRWVARDGLTGVLAHAALQELLEVEFARAQRSGTPTSLALIDIDHVGALNALHGYASGDDVIRLLAEHLTQQLRFIDHVGRYVDGAFCVVLPHCSPEDAQRAIERIRLQFQSQTQTLNGCSDIDVTFSAGVAGLHDASSVEAGLDAVDQRLYRAKLAGRNRVLGDGDA
ncbi:diguanylate cyclase [Chromohalobacter nigrandesensis]|uniref:diguanylate cyclase n=1 Tax=Chromohalobacter nigrandesensis TaxID=119863 RepID=UPI001FF5E27B|nr:diguanylate cyclase [Chromohalobacter nigrandesensis]MCK0746168.1 diguanylate cyclase [Chromohalobacter nigrandesensis]